MKRTKELRAELKRLIATRDRLKRDNRPTSAFDAQIRSIHGEIVRRARSKEIKSA